MNSLARMSPLKNLRTWLLLLPAIVGGLLAGKRLAAQSPNLTVAISVPASQVPQGEHVPVQIAVSGCSPSCYSASVLVDGTYAYGTGIKSDGTITTLSLDTVPIGAHTIQAQYDDPSRSPVLSPISTFTVVPNRLPVPTIAFQLNPTAPVAGAAMQLAMALSCGARCGVGGGMLYIDGAYAGFNMLDENGVALFATGPGRRSFRGRHTHRIIRVFRQFDLLQH